MRDVLTLGGLALLTFRSGLVRTSELMANVLHIAAAENVPVLLISQSSSTAALCVVTTRDEARRLRGAVEQRSTGGRSLPAAQGFTVSEPVALVSLVDDEMIARPGSAASFFGALGDAGVNVVAIAQSSDERRITCCVHERDRDAAERALRLAPFRPFDQRRL